MSKKVSHAYVQGLIWVLTYYVHGNAPVPITGAHNDALIAAQDRLQGKANNAADSSEGLGAAWDWYVQLQCACPAEVLLSLPTLES